MTERPSKRNRVKNLWGEVHFARWWLEFHIWPWVIPDSMALCCMLLHLSLLIKSHPDEAVNSIPLECSLTPSLRATNSIICHDPHYQKGLLISPKQAADWLVLQMSRSEAFILIKGGEHIITHMTVCTVLIAMVRDFLAQKLVRRYLLIPFWKIFHRKEVAQMVAEKMDLEAFACTP